VDNPVKEIKDVCYRLLAGREHSKKQLLQKLIARGFDKDMAMTVINELAQEGWQDDCRYAENYVRSRILKGNGPVLITYELQQNGVDLEVVNLEEIVQATAGNWMTLLEQTYWKKFGQDDSPIDMNKWAKRSRFLMQRGFTGAMLSEFFKHLNIL
jgi:regulatory protein